jgi:hypothetical protein
VAIGRYSRLSGPRQRLAEAIVRDPTASWKQHGAPVLDWLAKNDQAKYAQLAIGNLPRDVLVSVEQRVPGGLSVEDWGLMLRVLDLI